MKPKDVLIGKLNGKTYVLSDDGYEIIILNSDGSFYKKAGGYGTDPGK